MKIFIAGARVLRSLSPEVVERLNNIIDNNFTVLVGDANGIDKIVQNFFYAKHYSNVKVYATNGIARNNIGQWEVINVEVNSKKKDFNYFVAKDLEMAKIADFGLMIWNKKSRGTLNNMINLLGKEKKVALFIQTEKTMYHLKSLDELENLLKEKTPLETVTEYKNLYKKFENRKKQETLIPQLKLKI